MIINRFRRMKPHFTYKESVIFSKNNKIIQLNNDYNKKIILELEASLFEKLIFKSRILTRFFRLGIKSSTNYQNKQFLFSYKKKIYSYNIKSKKLRNEHSFRAGRGPMNYTIIDNLKNFENGIIFGEYFANDSRKEIHIYKRNSKFKWEIIYTFKKGLINHIHSIIVDKYSNCLWVFAGDFDQSSSIWRIKNNFKKVERILFGNQIYRACYGYPTKDGLIYATDMQDNLNSIRILKINNNKFKSIELYKINGPCIYGTNLKDYLVFSTSTEVNYHPRNNKFLLYFGNKPGPGILENKSDIVIYHKKKKTFKILSSFKKDFLPYGIFGLGSVMFPVGLENENMLYAFLSGSKKFDQDCLCFDLNKFNNNFLN